MIYSTRRFIMAEESGGSLFEVPEEALFIRVPRGRLIGVASAFLVFVVLIGVNRYAFGRRNGTYAHIHRSACGYMRLFYSYVFPCLESVSLFDGAIRSYLCDRLCSVVGYTYAALLRR